MSPIQRSPGHRGPARPAMRTPLTAGRGTIGPPPLSGHRPGSRPCPLSCRPDIHSRFSRACSKNCDIEHLAWWPGAKESRWSGPGFHPPGVDRGLAESLIPPSRGFSGCAAARRSVAPELPASCTGEVDSCCRRRSPRSTGAVIGPGSSSSALHSGLRRGGPDHRRAIEDRQSGVRRPADPRARLARSAGDRSG